MTEDAALALSRAGLAAVAVGQVVGLLWWRAVAKATPLEIDEA